MKNTRTCLVLLALACGLAVCTAQLSNAAVTLSASGTNTATIATVSFNSMLGEAASSANSVDLPCFKPACTCDPSSGVTGPASPTITWTSPSATCPVSGTGSFSGSAGASSFAASNSLNPAIGAAAAPSFSVTASSNTASGSGSLTLDNAGPAYTLTTNFGGGATSALSQATISTADLKSGATTAGLLIFNFTTANPVPSGGKVIINLPCKYLTSVPTPVASFTSCSAVTVVNTGCPAVCTSNTITCTTSGLLAAGANAIVFPATWVAGQPGTTGSFTVTTQTSSGQTIDAAPTAGATLQAFTSSTLTLPTMTQQYPSDLNAQVANPVGWFAFGFTTVNAVPSGGKVILTTPSNFFSKLNAVGWTGGGSTSTCNFARGTTQDTITCTLASTGLNANTLINGNITANVASNWGILSNQAAGAFTVMTQTAAGYTIDAAVSGTTPATVAVGTISVGSITASSFSVAADMNPGLTLATGNLTFSITSSVVIKSTGTLVFTLPYKFISATSTPFYITASATTGTCTSADSLAGAVCPPASPGTSTTTLTCTLSGDFPATSTSLILSPPTNAWRINSAMAAGKISVQALTAAMGIITTASSQSDTPALGGQVGSTLASAASVPADKLPGVQTTGTLTFSFSLVGLLSTGSKMIITLPSGYLSNSNGANIPATISTGSLSPTSCVFAQAQAAAPTACPPTAAVPSTLTCTVGSTAMPTGATVLTLTSGWSLGTGASGSYSVNTINNNNPGNPVDSMSATATLVAATATGAVSAVQAAVFSAPTDQNPALSATTGTLKFTFTTATTLPAGNVMITLRSTVGNYLTTFGAFTTMMGSTPASGPGGSCVLSSSFAQNCASTGCTGATPASTTYQVISCGFTSSLTAGVVTLSLTQGTYTVGSSQPAASYTVSTSNNAGTIDTTSTSMGTLPALAAGAVSAVSTAAFSVPADMVPGTTSTGTLTFGFTTATDLAVNAIVVISLPVGYLSTVTTAKLGANACSTFLLGSGTMGTCPGTTYQKLTCTVGTAAPKGVQSLVLQTGFVVGPKNAGTTYMAWTTTSGGAIIDTPASGSVPAITVGGTASGSGTATASVAGDMIPGTSVTGTLSLSFTIATAVPKTGGNIVFNLTPLYLKTATAATLTGGSTTSTCSSVSLSLGSLASACTAAVMQTITCAVGTANLAPGSYTLVLSAWSVNNAQSAGTFSVQTNNNGIALDTASATTGILPAYGGSATVSSVATAGASAATEVQKVGTATGSTTLLITFVTATKIVTGGSVTFKFPANYLSTSAGTLTQGATTVACGVAMSGSSVVLTVNADLPAGTSILTLTAGWIPLSTANAALFPAVPNYNKGTYTISNLITPPIYNAATSTSTKSIQFTASSAESSCSLSYPQIGSTSGPGGNTPASSGQQLLFSVLAVLGSMVLLLL